VASDKQQVTLAFAGDEAPLVSSFGRVGSASSDMATKVGDSSTRVGESASSFDRVGDSADAAEGKAQGFSDTLTGLADIGGGTAEIMKGNLFEGFVTVGQGAADLAGGLASFVIPAVKNMTKASLANAAQSIRTAAATVVHRGATLAGAAAARVMAVAQRALNLAMRANPIGIVITVLAALVAGIVIAYKRSATFRAVVQTAMRGVQTAFGWVVTKGGQLIGFFKNLPGKIGGFVSGVSRVITAPFRDAFAAVRRAWNSTVGGKGFTVPDWIPGLGGKSFRIPYFHRGGTMPGAPGTEGLAMLQAGERVTPAGASGTTTIVIRDDGSALAKLLVKVLQKAIREQGGDVQAVLGGP
jgi:phage-related protein